MLFKVYHSYTHLSPLRTIVSKPNKKAPEKPFTGFYQQAGIRYFQGIYADRAVSESCVSCHNGHANSPRRDYKLNDIMGGVIVTIPISEAP